ncbi:MAG: heparan-alpha-glucosaminide N-acetyltransferase domain-containing protein [Bryobacteraceae bacterium]
MSVASETKETAGASGKIQGSRIQSIDVARGLVMILMAVDHVRVYSGIPAGGATAGIFFTRWVTHFCAPGFAFLAGTSAFLYGRRLASKRGLARYLATRGILLVALELTFLRFAWTFNLDYTHFVLAGVIWMLGWCMVLLGGLVSLPTKAAGAIGLGIIFFQQIFSVLPRALPEPARNSIGWIWEFIYPAALKRPEGITILYVLVPWVGVMAAGYAFGAIMTREPEERRQLCLKIGLAATFIFLTVGCLVLFLDPTQGDTRPFLFRLLDQKKYPASQLYLLMTLGPTIAFLGVAERARGWLVEISATFGRVPMFYYLLHIPTIHMAALLVMLAREGRIYAEWYATAPFTSVPPEHRWGLPLLYAVFAAVVSLLYFACRWFGGVKARHRDSLLRYI